MGLEEKSSYSLFKFIYLVKSSKKFGLSLTFILDGGSKVERLSDQIIVYYAKGLIIHIIKFNFTKGTY